MMLKDDAAHGLMACRTADKHAMVLKLLKSMDLVLSFAKDGGKSSGFFNSLLVIAAHSCRNCKSA